MAGLAEAVFDGGAGGGGARGHAELAVDRAQVRADGVRADEQPLGHLGVGEPLGCLLYTSPSPRDS